MVWWHDAVHDFKKHGFFQLQYFTIWGVWLTTGYFTFAVITHLRYLKRDKQMQDNDSLWCSWKWVSSLYMTAFLWECVIASVYWSILYPADRKGYLKDNPSGNWWNCCDHFFPIVALITDWFLNRIYFEFNQFWANMIVFMVYGLVNIGVTKGSGTPVYPPISWDSVGSWFLGLALLPLAAGYYMGLYYLTRLKFRKMKMHDAIEYMSQASEVTDLDQEEHLVMTTEK